MTTQPAPKKCLCGKPVATWLECPVACKAGLCKTCFQIYHAAGVLQQVKA